MENVKECEEKATQPMDAIVTVREGDIVIRFRLAHEVVINCSIGP